MMIRKVLPAVLAATAVAFAACGNDESGGVRGDARGNPIDRGFVAEMIPHHQSAVEMAKIAQRRGEGDFVRSLGNDIVTSQSAEITTLRREDQGLDEAGIKREPLPVADHMKGMDDDPKMLETARPFDPAFMKMMIPHHRGAIEMAKVEIQKGSDPELKALAQAIIDAQAREIRAMERELQAAESGSRAAS